MTQNEIYQFFLCLITFTLLTVLFTVLVVWIIRLNCRLIESGLNDEKIKKEYLEKQEKKPSIIGKMFDCLVLIVLCVVFLCSFAFSIFVSSREGKVINDIPTINVVKSSSMSYINSDHQYLKEGQVTDQIQMFDLIVVNKLPAEKDLKVTDIVVYEVDGVMIIHRIVAIEEPNANHEERHFLLHGDANKAPDYFPVRYDQMKGIYSGTRMPMVGSFVMFMQSPSGYLCIILMLFALISVPIAEKSLRKRINARLIAMGLIDSKESTVVDDVTITEIPETNKFASFGARKDTRTFIDRLESASDAVKARYNLLNDTLLRFKKIRVIEGKIHHSYRCGSLSVARFTIRGKTLNIYLGLDPKEFENTKYIYTDVSAVNKHANYPMRIKLSSDRQARWANELILLLAKNNSIALLDKPQTVEKVEEKSALNITAKDNRTFEQKLNDLPIAKERFENIKELLESVKGVRVIDSKKQRTYKSGGVALARFTVRGKTLNAYIALKPEEFTDTKYIYTDVSSVNKYANYPMRVKVSSDRQARWAKELLIEKINSSGLTILEQTKQTIEENKPFYANLKNTKDERTFDQKLNDLPITKERFEKIKEELLKISKIREIVGKKQRTFKVGNIPLVRFTVRGKTLNAYIALNPKEFENTKYIYTDVSAVNKHANYPMRVKVSSNRQEKWVVELVRKTLERKEVVINEI